MIQGFYEFKQKPNQLSWTNEADITWTHIVLETAAQKVESLTMKIKWNHSMWESLVVMKIKVKCKATLFIVFSLFCFDSSLETSFEPVFPDGYPEIFFPIH